MFCIRVTYRRPPFLRYSTLSLVRDVSVMLLHLYRWWSAVPDRTGLLLWGCTFFALKTSLVPNQCIATNSTYTCPGTWNVQLRQEKKECVYILIRWLFFCHLFYRSASSYSHASTLFPTSYSHTSRRMQSLSLVSYECQRAVHLLVGKEGVQTNANCSVNKPSIKAIHQRTKPGELMGVEKHTDDICFLEFSPREAVSHTFSISTAQP